jgi:hypothetical protein
MAISITLKCDTCSYSVLTNGGPSACFRGYLNTFVCVHCKELNDLLVDRFDQTAVDNPTEKYVELYGEEQLDHGYTKQIKGQKCNSCRRQKFIWWDYQLAPCTKCNGKLHWEEDGEGLMWD